MGWLPLKLHHRFQSRAGTGKGRVEGIAATSTVSLDLSPHDYQYLDSGAEQLCGAYVSVHPASLTMGAHVMLSLFSVRSGPRVCC